MKRLGLYVAAGALFACITSPVTAASITLTSSDGTTTYTVDLPDDVISLIGSNTTAIADTLEEESVTQSDLNTIASEVTNAYNSASSIVGVSNPYSTALNGLNDFTDVLVDVIPNTQGIQNVWASSWIGYILPKPNFGFGINAGVSSMDISALTDTAEALGMSVSAPNTLVFPTITADARVGGFFLPFDVGFVVSALDSSKLGLDSTLDPISFNYFTVGGDIRYCVWKMPIFKTRISVGAGLYHTEGTVEADDSSADAKLDFNSTTLSLSAQASAKFLFFTPFLGTRLMFSKTNVDWSVSGIQWTSIIGSTYSDSIAKAISYGLLPTSFSGGSSAGFFDNVRPVLYGGFAFNLLLLDVTFSGSYDFLAQIPSGAVSVRLSL